MLPSVCAVLGFGLRAKNQSDVATSALTRYMCCSESRVQVEFDSKHQGTAAWADLQYMSETKSCCRVLPFFHHERSGEQANPIC